MFYKIKNFTLGYKSIFEKFLLLFCVGFFVLSANTTQAENIFVFNNNLKTGNIRIDVQELQKFFNANGYTVAKTGPGAIGKETTKFGFATRSALIKFQKANKITPAFGYFGPITRAVVNKIISDKNVSLLYEPSPILPGWHGLITYSLVYHSDGHGSIIGSSSQTVNRGNDGSTVTAVPNSGYRFDSWSDGVLTAERTDTNIISNKTVNANFIKIISVPAITGITVPETGATPTSTILDTTEYTATISWSSNPVIFSASTIYTATITLTPKAGYTLNGVFANFFTVAGATATNLINSGIISAVFPETAPPVLSGPVSITGTTKFGQTLTADISNLIYTPTTILDVPTYQWRRGDVVILGATAATYVLVQSDIGNLITVTITADGIHATGNITSSATSTIAKADGPVAPSAPTEASKTSTSITLTANILHQFSKDAGVNWQDSEVFTDLTASTEYTFVARVKETSTTNASVASVETVITTSPDALSIGDSYQGGLVAYILQAGDPGYEAGQTHGLIVTTSDQGGGLITWGCYGTALVGADATALGTGNQNTIDIMAGCATSGIAARIAGDLDLNGYTDWYLPSKDELYKLYVSRAILGIPNVYYWSSSEYSANYARSLGILNGNWLDFTNKGVTGGYVRAMRSF